MFQVQSFEFSLCVWRQVVYSTYCDEITVRLKARKFRSGLEAHPNTVRVEFSYLIGERGMGTTYDLGVCQSYRLTAVSPACPTCLSRPKHALTRYNYRCDLRLSSVGSGWLTLWC
jgi:hypothetical protein